MIAIPTRSARPPAAGYTLVELLVSMTVFVGILVAVLTMFNFNYKLARVQTHVADMQQSLRIAQHDLVRMVRMTGRGGLPRGTLPLGQAISVQSNVPVNTLIGAAGTPDVLAGTDILTIRGVFSTPYFQINPAGGNFTLDNPAAPTSGTVRIQDPNPQTGVRQDLTELAAGIEAATPIAEPLLLVSPLDDSIFAVVEIDPGGSTVERLGGVITSVTVDFDIVPKYLPLSGGAFPPTLQNVAFVGVLEEYRYYVRETYAIAGDPTSELVPRLTVARFFPGTNNAYAGSNTNLMVDLADNILDFQVVLGVDTDDDDEIDENVANPENDEWLYNHPDDDDTEARWDTVPGSPGVVPDLFYVRLTTLGRTDRPDFKYVSPPIDQIEDHDLSEPVTPVSLADLQRRRYRRWQLQTVVDLRNI